MATKPPGQGGGAGLHALRRRPAVLLGGGAVAVVVVVALIKRQSANSAATTSSTAANPQQATYDSSLNDIYNQFENQFESLQASIAGLQGTPTTGTTSTTSTGGTSTGTTSSPPGVPIIQGGSATGPTGVSRPAPAPVAPAANTFTQAIYKVVGGDTLSSIAAKFGESWQTVYSYNLKSGVRPAATQATLKSRGPNKIYSGESIYIPNK